VLIPRTLGLYTALLALKNHITGFWDLTIKYDNLTSDQRVFPEDIYGLVSLLGERKGPKLIKIHINWCPNSSIPLEEEPFENWLRGLFYQKERLIETGKPSNQFLIELPLISDHAKLYFNCDAFPINSRQLQIVPHIYRTKGSR
jgi:hypothetical protein